MNKISYGQFASMLLVSDVFTLICYSKKMSLITLICFLAVSVFQFIVLLPSNRKSRISSRFMLYIYLITAVLWGSLLFIRVWQTAKNIYIPVPDIPFISENLIISSLVATVCLYASSQSLKAVSRSAVISVGFGILCIIIIILGSLKTIRFRNLMIHDSYSLYDQSFAVLSSCGSIYLFPYLLSQLKDPPQKIHHFYFISKGIFYLTAVTLTLLTTGGIMEITQFPVMRSAELCQPFSSQRVDSLFIIVLVVFATVSISVQTSVASKIIADLFPKFKRFRSTAVISAMILFSLILGQTDIYSPIYAIIFTLPIIISAIISLSGKGENK